MCNVKDSISNRKYNTERISEEYCIPLYIFPFTNFNDSQHALTLI